MYGTPVRCRPPRLAPGGALLAIGTMSLVVSHASCVPFAATPDPPPSAQPAAPASAAGAAGAPPAPAATVSSCPAGHFCDGFARPDPVDQDWTTYGAGLRTRLTIDRAMGDRTAGGALHVATTAGDTTDHLEIHRAVTSLANLKATFSIRRAAGGSSSEIQPVIVAGSMADDIYVALDNATVAVVEFSGGEHNPSALLPLPADTWTRCRLEVDADATHAVLVVDDREVTLPLRFSHLPPYLFAVGATSALPSRSAADVWLDDVDLTTN
jgi:hypothetical protein